MEAKSALAARRILVSLAKELFFILVDFSFLVLAILIAYQVYRYLGIGRQVRYSMPDLLPASVCFACAAILVLILSGAYENKPSILNVEETKRFVKGISVSALLISVALVFSKIQLSRYVLCLSFAFSVFLIVVEKLFFYHILPRTRHFSWMNRRVLIYGAGILGQNLYRSIANSPRLDIHPVGFIDDDPKLQNLTCHSGGYRHNASSLSVIGTGENLRALLEALDIDEVFIAISNVDSDKLSFIRKQVLAGRVKMCFVPNLHHNPVHKLSMRSIGQIPMIQEQENTPPALYVAVKKVLDLFQQINTTITKGFCTGEVISKETVFS